MGNFFSKGLQFMGFLRALPIILALIGLLAVSNGGGLPDLGKILPTNARNDEKWIRGKVVRVVDGDTLEVRTAWGREKVRMLGIDTPETVRPGVSVECGGPEASEFMKKLATGMSVKLVTDPTQDERDRYDRLLAYVEPTGKQWTLQERILRAGWATTYVYGRKFRRYQSFSDAEEEARKAGRGVWSACGGDFHRPR